MSLAVSKAELRRRSLAARRDLAQKNPDAALSVAARLADVLRGFTGVIAGYMTIGDELDCLPVLRGVEDLGVPVCLPVAAGQGERLIFREWQTGGALVAGPFGTSHPGPAAAVVEPDLLLVPLLAFDRQGHRLGYGAGYYDRTLAWLRRSRAVTAIGLAFDGQEVDAIPADPTDQRLDAVMTERRLLVFTDRFAFARTDAR